MTNPVFAELNDQLTNLDAFVETARGVKGKAVFYSGDEGKNAELAKQCTEINPDAYTIHQTPAGKFVDNQGRQALRDGFITKDEFHELGNTASQMFAAEAEGHGIVFAKGAQVTGTLAQKEAPVFGLGNSNLTSLNGVDINLVKDIGVNTQAQMENTLQMLGDYSSLDNCRPPNGSAGAVITTSKLAATIIKTEAQLMVPHFQPAADCKPNYGLIAAGAVVGVASVVVPPGEVVAGAMLTAGGAGALIGGAASCVVKKPDDQSLNIDQQLKLNQALTQLKDSGASLQTSSDNQKLQSTYAYSENRAQTLQVG